MIGKQVLATLLATLWAVAPAGRVQEVRISSSGGSLPLPGAGPVGFASSPQPAAEKSRRTVARSESRNRIPGLQVIGVTWRCEKSGPNAQSPPFLASVVPRVHVASARRDSTAPYMDSVRIGTLPEEPNQGATERWPLLIRWSASASPGSHGIAVSTMPWSRLDIWR